MPPRRTRSVAAAANANSTSASPPAPPPSVPSPAPLSSNAQTIRTQQDGPSSTTSAPQANPADAQPVSSSATPPLEYPGSTPAAAASMLHPQTPPLPTPPPTTTRTTRPPTTQRLASIMPPRPLLASSGSARGAATGTVARPRFSGRRSQTARLDLVEQQEAERRKTVVEAQAVGKESSAGGVDGGAAGGGRRDEVGGAARGGRGRGFVGRGLFVRGRGRGRGGFMGEGERVMSGPFSSGMVNQVDKGKGARGTGGSRGAARDGGGTGSTATEARSTTVASENGAASEGISLASAFASASTTAKPARTSRTAKKGSSAAATADGKSVKPDPDRDGDTFMTGAAGAEYISSGSDDDAVQEVKGRPRRNVDEMVVVVDLTHDGDDDDEPQGMQPVRLRRDVHKERTRGLNADGTDIAIAGIEGGGLGGVKAPFASEKRRGKQRTRDRDFEITGESRRVNATTYSSSESETEGGRAEIKLEPVDEDAGADAAVVGGARVITPEPVPAAPAELHSPPSSPEARRKAKERVKQAAAHPPPERPAYQTQEEADEWARAQEDVRVLRAELSRPASAIEGEDLLDAKADKVYLFQFPPVLPDLRVVVVKDEMEMTGAAQTSTAATAASADQNGTADAMEVEGAKQSSAIKIADPAPTLASALPAPSTRLPELPSGSVGKLRVHASGKVTLDWGGTPLVLGRGTDATFLQDVMVARMPEAKSVDPGIGGKMVVDDEEEREGGVLMGMGQVRGKFVVTPDWEEILG